MNKLLFIVSMLILKIQGVAYGSQNSDMEYLDHLKSKKVQSVNNSKIDNSALIKKIEEKTSHLTLNQNLNELDRPHEENLIQQILNNGTLKLNDRTYFIVLDQNIQLNIMNPAISNQLNMIINQLNQKKHSSRIVGYQLNYLNGKVNASPFIGSNAK